MARAALIVVWLGLLVVQHAPLASAGFVYQDYRLTDACDTPWQMRTLPRALTRASWCAQLAYLPSPRAFHLVNVGLHLIVAGLLWGLVRPMAQTMALVAAGVWALHPLHLEGVAYLSARGELFAAIGVVGACVAVQRRRWWLAGACALFGVLGKESAVVVVALAPLVVARPRAVLASTGVLAGLTVAVVLDLEIWRGGSLMEGLRWIAVQATALVRLTGMLIVPWGQTVDYDYAQIPMAWQLMAVLMFIGMAVTAWRLRASWPLLAMGLAWIVLATFPRFAWYTPRNVFPEYQFYLPSMAVAFLVCARKA